MDDISDRAFVSLAHKLVRGDDVWGTRLIPVSCRALRHPLGS